MIVMSKQKCIKTLQSIEATQQNKRRVLTKHYRKFFINIFILSFGYEIDTSYD